MRINVTSSELPEIRARDVSYGRAIRLQGFPFETGGMASPYLVIRPPHSTEPSGQLFRKVNVVNLVTGFTYLIDPGRIVFLTNAEVCIDE